MDRKYKHVKSILPNTSTSLSIWQDNKMHDRKHCHFIGFSIFVGLLVALAGCIPAIYTYWQPHGEWGKLINPSEVNIISNDTLEVRLSDIKVWVNGNGKSVTIRLLIPQGKSAEFVSDEVTLFVGRSTNILRFDSISSSDKDVLRPSDTMVGSKLYGRLIGEDQPKSFWVSIDLGGEEKSQYGIKPPAIKIGNQVSEMPRIEFNKKTGFGIGGP
jgi:hypothetical protein